MTAPALAQGVAEGGTAAPARLVRWPMLVVACAAAFGSFKLAFASDELSERGLQAALLNWTTLPYILAGVIAWWRRPDSRFGPLMVGAGFAMFLSSLQWSSHGLPYTVGLAFDLLPAALLVHLLLAFPSGRLERTPERLLVVVGYSAAIGLQLAKMLLGGAETRNVLALGPGSGVGHTVEDVQLVTLSVVCLAGVVILAGRRRGSVRRLPPRIALFVDSFATGLVAVAVLLLAGAFEWPQFETIRRVAFAIIGVAPVAFLIGLLNEHLSRSTLGHLLVRLRADPAPGDLREALAEALRDQSLTVAYWLPEFGRWVDRQGRPVELPEPDSGRASTPIDRDGRRMAVLIHDASLADEPQLLDGVQAAAGIALENGRLHAELNARLEELRGSRRRMIEAGQLERQRLERDLHDGAQQRLIALSLELGLLEERLRADPEIKGRLDQARDEIALSLEELRAVARGIHPAVVSGHGLAVALESLTVMATVPVRLTVELDERMPERLEVAAYYVVSESLANIAKHAGATSATVDVARVDGQVVVEIVDNGVGGADTERGSGLRGLADRVEGLGGRLRIWTPRGGGTRVRAEMPCV
ncbi:MAG TPA: histidine kinase [Thermoleophilaceae bacterium]|nr:histidine kinase [Thermoleophilaceae bacterium]